MIGLAGCGSEDPATAQSCSFHSECPVGSSCSFQNKCIQAACENCKNDPSLICLKTDENPEGVCSRPECTSDDECDTAAGETCNDGVCGTGGGSNNGEGCTSNDDCGEGESCNLQNQCVPDGGGDCTSSADCGEGEYCDSDTSACETGECADSTDCAEDETCDDNHTCVTDGGGDCGGSCPTGQTCNTSTNQCEDDTNPPCGGSCPTGQVCNEQTDQCEPEQTCDPACGANEICDTTNGTCVEDTCPVGTPEPEDCANDPVYNKFDPDGCFCAQCLSDSDCDTAAGETCNPNGECIVCNESCDPSQGGNACSQSGFYCVSDCCVECIGNTDCASGEVCVDGSCGAPPDCSVDPSVCTGGMTCNQSTGQCETPQTGTSCTQGSCPSGQFCDPTTQTCQSLTGGGGGCDPASTMCNSDCTCPGQSTCEMGMFCVGCSGTIISADCPPGQMCLAGMCIALQ